MAATEQKAWPYGGNLEAIRKGRHLSVSKASKLIDVDRQTWTAWEAGRQRPKYETLKAIVEAFECPPEMIGYEPPQGWELVPAEWVSAEMAAIRRENQELKLQLGNVLDTILARLPQ